MIGYRKIAQSTTFSDFPSGEVGILADCSNGDVYVTLPTANLSNRDGSIVYLAKTDSTLNYIWVQKDDGAAFNEGSTIKSQNYPYDTLILTVVAGKWYVAWQAAWS